MKRKIASRKLKRTCLCCNQKFKKGNVYYLRRVVFKVLGEIVAYEYLTCARCKYYSEQQDERKKRFKDSGKCHHPITNVVWTTMLGEDYVKEPSHTECCICGKHV